MARRTKSGFHVAMGDFTLQQHPKLPQKNPTGIYISMGRPRLFLHYTYADPKEDASEPSFQLPRDPSVLRDLADALSRGAQEIERARLPRR